MACSTPGESGSGTAPTKYVAPAMVSNIWPSQSRPASGYLQLPSSTDARSSRLHDNASVQPDIGSSSFMKKLFMAAFAAVCQGSGA